MDPRRLTHQANQIARFFEAQGEAAAIAGVEDHLRKFWDPRMRAEFIAHLAAGGDGLALPPARAVARLAGGRATPPPSWRGAERRTPRHSPSVQ